MSLFFSSLPTLLCKKLSFPHHHPRLGQTQPWVLPAVRVSKVLDDVDDGGEYVLLRRDGADAARTAVY